MPEGPEAKIASSYLNSYFKGENKIQFKLITNYYKLKYKDVFENLNRNIGNSFESFTVGKNIFINLNNKTKFNFHLGMTGGWSKQNIKHCHFEISNNNKSLFFIDVRKFAKMRIITEELFNSKFNHHHDLLNKKYNLAKHQRFLDEKLKTKRSVCSILMDQKYFPGVGNYIKSEALFLSELHPEEKWSNLSPKQVKKLILNTKDIMNKSFESGGAELKDFKNPNYKSKFILNIYGRKKTLNNKNIISINTSDQRRSWICPEIQKLNN